MNRINFLSATTIIMLFITFFNVAVFFLYKNTADFKYKKKIFKGCIKSNMVVDSINQKTNCLILKDLINLNKHYIHLIDKNVVILKYNDTVECTLNNYVIEHHEVKKSVDHLLEYEELQEVDYKSLVKL